MKNNRFASSNFKEVFGELESVRRIRRGLTEKIFLPAITLLPGICGVIAYAESGDWLTIPVCVLPFLLLFAGLVRHLFSTRRDELRIYEHGFTYRSRRRLQICLWQDIKTLHRRELTAREMVTTEIFPLGAVEKNNGEIIEIDQDISAAEIVSQFEIHRMRRNPERKRKAK